MEIKALEELLGIRAPWRVADITVDVVLQEVLVRVECEDTEWCNPQRRLQIHGWEQRRWRHLDLWQCRTIIEAEGPRWLNPATGRTAMATVPWAQGLSCWSKRFESWAMEVLLRTRSISDGSRLLGLGWDSLRPVPAPGRVERGLQRRQLGEVKRVGIDEKSFRRGQDYIALMTDLVGAHVLEVVAGAGQKEVEARWQTLPEAQRQQVAAVAMDRGKSMIAGTRAAAPQAAIVQDRYPISAEPNQAVDRVRRAEPKPLMEQGDETLKGPRYQWLSGLEKLSDAGLASFNTRVRIQLKTSRAWELKATFESFWEQVDAASGLAFFQRWKNRALRSRLPIFVQLAQSLATSLPELLNYFEYRLSKAMSEGFNRVIQQLKAAARGFRNFANYRSSILFFCGKLDLKPSL